MLSRFGSALYLHRHRCRRYIYAVTQAGENLVRKIFLWLGAALYVFGVALIISNIVMHYVGLSTQYDFGDPTRFHFVRFWHLGFSIAIVGVACLLLWRRLSR
jgi:hypothetical protein